MSTLTADKALNVRPATNARADLLLRSAVREGQELYFERCRNRVPSFVARHMSLRGATRRYYPPRPAEIARLAISVAITPIIAVVQVILWVAGRGHHPSWLAVKSGVQRFALPRAHAELAQAVQSEIFGLSSRPPHDAVRELEQGVISSTSFAAYTRLVLANRYPEHRPEELDRLSRQLVANLHDEVSTARANQSEGHADIDAIMASTRQSIAETELHRDLENIVAGEAARSDVVNTILTGFIAKLALGQLKFGAYGLALMIAPPLYFQWSSGNEERIRRTIDGLLPDGRWSLSRLGWNFDWTESFESVALMAALFLGLSALLSIVGYLLAPLLAPVWRATGLPAMSLRRTVEATRDRAVEGGTRPSLSPEIFASKIGDLAELFSRSG